MVSISGTPLCGRLSLRNPTIRAPYSAKTPVVRLIAKKDPWLRRGPGTCPTSPRDRVTAAPNRIAFCSGFVMAELSLRSHGVPRKGRPKTGRARGAGHPGGVGGYSPRPLPGAADAGRGPPHRGAPPPAGAGGLSPRLTAKGTRGETGKHFPVSPDRPPRHLAPSLFLSPRLARRAWRRPPAPFPVWVPLVASTSVEWLERPVALANQRPA